MSRHARLTRTLIAAPVTIDGWRIELVNGKIHVSNPAGQQIIVDVYNPLKDQELVKFHNRPDVPEQVKNKAEALASQWRRIIHTTDEWHDMKANDKMPPYKIGN